MCVFLLHLTYDTSFTFVYISVSTSSYFLHNTISPPPFWSFNFLILVAQFQFSELLSCYLWVVFTKHIMVLSYIDFSIWHIFIHSIS